MHEQGIPEQRLRHPLWLMRVVVMGAGSVGCYVGGSLTKVADVTLIGRERLVSAIGANGLVVSGIDHAAVEVPSNGIRVTTSPSDVVGADVVLVTTKSHATRSAEEIAPNLTSEAVVISLQNGLRNVEIIQDTLAERIPDSAERPVVLVHEAEDAGSARRILTGGELLDALTP